MARRFIDAPNAALGLAGQGVRDVDPHRRQRPRPLGADPRRERATPVRDVLLAFRDDLDRFIDALAEPTAPGARRRWPRSSPAGTPASSDCPASTAPTSGFTTVVVMVEDRPGELARLLAEIGEIGVNLEDLRLEHSPGPTGRTRRDRRAARGGRSTHQRAGRTRLADSRLNVSVVFPLVVAVDGPAGSGKSSVSKEVARRSGSASSTRAPRTARWRGTSRRPGSTRLTRHPSSRACRASRTASAPTPPAMPCTSATST
jgi:hypothetical protein